MSEFEIFFKLGIEHILDLNGYDHLLFIVALCTVYALKDWKKMFALATAFTLGHSITLALATFELVSFPSDIIEFLIPVTIIITAVVNLFRKESSPGPYPYSRANNGIGVSYFFATFFGLVHGLGFSNYLRSMLGKSSSITSELIAFNLGIEVAQLVIVLVFLLVSYILVSLGGIKRREWNVGVSSGVIALAVSLAVAAKFW
ncbi:hypothetical protein FUAX_06150 [Fulvitalea axinellae]|uniref:HupE / UreJ protein n=1 Tax=Fulvitalea axinellae TaxID=1182444 RepID=A0AAU9CX86_9BACT|nr:hypothetical protein FUAX_06150 [Fulvitalea axinellae]